MIRFLKEIYLTGFVLLIRLSRGKDIGYKVGAACAIITAVEGVNLTNICSWVNIVSGKQAVPHLSGPEVWLVGIVLASINVYVLFTLRYGIKFESEFDNLKKSRKILLKVSCAALLLTTILFSIYTTKAYHHFLEVNGKSFNSTRPTLTPHA